MIIGAVKMELYVQKRRINVKTVLNVLTVLQIARVENLAAALAKRIACVAKRESSAVKLELINGVVKKILLSVERQKGNVILPQNVE